MAIGFGNSLNDLMLQQKQMQAVNDAKQGLSTTPSTTPTAPDPAPTIGDPNRPAPEDIGSSVPAGTDYGNQSYFHQAILKAMKDQEGDPSKFAYDPSSGFDDRLEGTLGFGKENPYYTRFSNKRSRLPYDVYNYQKGLKEGLYDPLLGETSQLVGKSDFVTDARLRHLQQSMASEGMSKRDIARYGVNQSNALMEHQADRANIGGALVGTQATNDARITTKAYDDSLRRGLINIGRGKMNSASAAAGFAASAQSSREQAGDAARAQHQAQQQQTAATAASVAITVAAMAMMMA